MNLTTIEMPVEEAKARLAEYEQSLRRDRNAEDEAIAAGYRAAARGLSVIRLSEAVSAGGWFEAGRPDAGLPRIAVVRADARKCWVEVDGWPRRAGGNVVFSSEERPNNRGALVGRATVLVQVANPPDRQTTWRSSTVVPIIPPRYRPSSPARLRGCHILWEVESWTPEPPKDPALIRHIRGDLWSVLAVWDLTELERAVLAQRSS